RYHSCNSLAVTLHRSGICDSHARSRPTARDLSNPTRGTRPPLGNRRILRAVTVHRSGIGKSHAREPSTAQELQNLTRRNVPPLGNWEISRAGRFYRTRTV